MFALTQVNTFKNALSINFTCDDNDISIVPISLMFAAVFGFLLFIQFICMLYHRFSTLIHITAETKILEDDHDKSMNSKIGMADFLTSPITSEPTKPELASDKIRRVLEMNRLVKIPEKEGKITSMEAIVEKQMGRLKDVKGTLYGKETQLAENVINKWKNRPNAAMAGLVIKAFPNLKIKQKFNGGKRNKVDPEPDTSSDSSCGPPPNGNLQNQEPISATDNNV